MPSIPPFKYSESPHPTSFRSKHHRSFVTRRGFLKSAGTGAALSSLAGCSQLSVDNDTDEFHDGEWHSYGNGPLNNNRVSGGAPKPETHESIALSDWLYAPPAVHRDIVYFAAGQRILAVSLDIGVVWSVPLDISVSGAPALDPDRRRLYVPTRRVPTTDSPNPARASVTAVSINDGQIVGTPQVGQGRTYGVTVYDGDVFVRSSSACVRLSPDGTEQWRRSLDPLIYDEYNLGDSTATQVAPAVTDDGVYVPDRNALVKLDPRTGQERWRVTVDTPYAPATIDERGVVQTGWQETVAVDHSGEIRWRRNLHSRAGAAAADGDIYVIAGDLYELDADTGETNWQTHLPSEGTAAPVVTDQEVIAAAGDVRAYRRNTSGLLAPGRQRWQTSSVHAAAYSSPVIAANRVFVVGPSGIVSLQSGEAA